MLKVFLVEDEYVVRKGIRDNIDWTSEGFIFCGEAARRRTANWPIP
ncbi:MAG: hypothetical protein LBS84_08255 [Clostridiales bacterium]|jgi:two-component system response regulator YesN|nr:hypothetical protein [Clostridiales bacterium]